MWLFGLRHEHGGIGSRFYFIFLKRGSVLFSFVNAVQRIKSSPSTPSSVLRFSPSHSSAQVAFPPSRHCKKEREDERVRAEVMIFKSTLSTFSDENRDREPQSDSFATLHLPRSFKWRRRLPRVMARLNCTSAWASFWLGFQHSSPFLVGFFCCGAKMIERNISLSTFSDQ